MFLHETAGGVPPLVGRRFDAGFKPGAGYAETLPDMMEAVNAAEGARVPIQQVGCANFRLPLRFRTAAGREVWLVTATPKEIADVIAHRLGLTGGLGTLVEVNKDGILTGKLIGQTLHGKAKRKAVKALAEERNISLKRSFAYSDSVNDLPMLTVVGHPTAINPDVALRFYAKEAAWPILDFKKRELRANKK